jgi:hypothetical protein
MRRLLQEKKRAISEGLRRRTHSSSVKRSLVEVERRFLVWMWRGMCDHVRRLFSTFVNACEFCCLGKHLGLGIDHSIFDVDAYTYFFLSAIFENFCKIV